MAGCSNEKGEKLAARPPPRCARVWLLLPVLIWGDCAEGIFPFVVNPDDPTYTRCLCTSVQVRKTT